MLTAIDGQVNGGGGIDKFRVKIWAKATGAIVYDNQMGAADDANPATAIQGGSIVIHREKWWVGARGPTGLRSCGKPTACATE